MKSKLKQLIEYRLRYHRTDEVVDSERFTMAEDDIHAIESFIAMTTKGKNCRDWHCVHRWNRFSQIWEKVNLDEHKHLIPECE